MTSAAPKSHVKSWLCLYEGSFPHESVVYCLKRRLQLWVLLSGALPVGLRQSERSGAAPWWRWSTEQPADDRTSAGKCCCILDDPGRGTGRLSTDPSSVNRRVTKHLTSQSCFSFHLLLFRDQWDDSDQTSSKPRALWISQRFSAGWRTYSVPPSLRASSCGRAHGGSSSVRTWWTDTAFPTQSYTENKTDKNKSSQTEMRNWWWLAQRHLTWSSHRSCEPCR